jgi:hypothetical protein
VSSPALSGGISESTMLPWTFAITSEDEELAKAFCAIAIITRPGARNSAKRTPAISRTAPPSASAKTASSSSVVTTGAATVCIPTLRKRRTSRATSVPSPIQLTAP